MARIPSTTTATTPAAPVSPSADTGDPSRRVATIERATDVLFLFTRDERTSLGVTEIATDLGISKAVVHRILTSLRECGLVIVDAMTHRYALGPAVLALAASYRDQLDVRPMALQAMDRLSRTTGETSTLSIRNGFHRLYVDQVTPPIEVRMTVRTGHPYPLHAGSSSKAFLAFLAEPERERFLATQPLEPITSLTVVDPATLRGELDQIRARGFAVSFGERQVGAASIAAPLLDRDGPVAVISVCGPLERLRDRVDEVSALLLDETMALSARLGHRPDHLAQ